MKLYATTTSERASKGQGGNKQIIIDLQIDPLERMEIGRVTMNYDKDTGYTVYYYPINENCVDQKINSGRVLLYQSKKESEIKMLVKAHDLANEKIKGNKQKGEMCEMEDCGYEHSHSERLHTDSYRAG